MDTLSILAARYGTTLTTPELAEAIGIAPGTLRNRRSAGTLGIPTWREGKRILAHVHDVASYLDAKRQAAADGQERRDERQRTDPLARWNARRKRLRVVK